MLQCLALKLIKIELLRRSLNVCGPVDCIVLIRQELNSPNVLFGPLRDCKSHWRRLWVLFLEVMWGQAGMDLQLHRGKYIPYPDMHLVSAEYGEPCLLLSKYLPGHELWTFLEWVNWCKPGIDSWISTAMRTDLHYRRLWPFKCIPR